MVLNESDVYRELTPPAWARHAIACFWVRRGDGRSVLVAPDACTDIVWRSGSGVTVAGPDRAAWSSPTQAGEVLVGARLAPGAGGAALGLPLAELRDTRVSLDVLGLDPRGQLDPGLAPAAAMAAMARIALGLVAQAAPDRAVQAAASALLAPHQRIDTLAAALGFSERQLRRRFDAAVGYGPKTLQRVLRLRRFMAVAGAGSTGGLDALDGVAGLSGGLAEAAAAAGYADQAHLARDCRALTGLTPRQLAG